MANQELKKISMNLTEKDVENAEIIFTKTNARTKAQVVSNALALARFIVERVKDEPGARLVVVEEDGTKNRIIVLGITD